MVAPDTSVVQSRIFRLSNQGPEPMIKLISATAMALVLAAPTQAEQFMLMFYENEAEVAAQRDNAERTGPYWEAWNAYVNELYGSGVVLRGDPLKPASTATTVRLEGGKRLVQNGPAAATEELLGGYVVIEVPDLEAALTWAERSPAATFGAVEVRPVVNLPTTR
jgi:hypothetical protein